MKMNLITVLMTVYLAAAAVAMPHSRHRTYKRLARSRLASPAVSLARVPRENTDSSALSYLNNPLNYVRTSEDERVYGDDGAYTFDIKTDNSIVLSEAGQSKSSGESIVKAGSYSFTLPDGNLFELKYVADEKGFQPESSYLPVAPVFPHPIPQFVLDQIEKAAREDAEREREQQRGNN